MIPIPLFIEPSQVGQLVFHKKRFGYMTEVSTNTATCLYLNIGNFYFTGSYNCRVGWSTSEKPLMAFKNLIAKPRKERGKKVDPSIS